MRHQCNKNRLGRAQDQRKALLRALATELLMHGEIKTTISRAKALKPYADNLITIAKKGDLKRIFGVMALGVKKGEEITVTCEGADEDAAAALEAFFKANL